MEDQSNLISQGGESMLIKQLVAKVLEKLNSLPAEDPRISTLVRFKSQIVVVQLKEFLENFANSGKEATLETVQPFCQFLQNLWQGSLNNDKGIRDTDAMYLHSPLTQASQICMALAKQLAPIVDEIPYKLLMPTLKVHEFEIKEREFSDLNPHEFVLDDQDQYPIEIFKCLELAKYKKGNLYHTCLIAGKEKLLSETEMSRVIDHSQAAKDYYNEIRNHRVNVNPLKRKEKKLREALKEDDYNVTVSYGEEGDRRLLFNICDDIENQKTLITALLPFPQADWRIFLDLINDHYGEQDKNNVLLILLECTKNKNQLFEVLKKLPLVEWKAFLKKISKENLAKIILNWDDMSEQDLAKKILDRNIWYPALQKALQEKNSYTGDELHDKAVLSCINELYNRLRSLQPNYTSTLGWLADISKLSGLVGVADKKKRESESFTFQNFLVSDAKLSDLDANIFPSGFMRMLAEQAKLVSHPEYHQAHQSVSWFAWNKT